MVGGSVWLKEMNQNNKYSGLFSQVWKRKSKVNNGCNKSVMSENIYLLMYENVVNAWTIRVEENNFISQIILLVNLIIKKVKKYIWCLWSFFDRSRIFHRDMNRYLFISVYISFYICN